VAIAHNLHRTIGNIDVCAESELFKVKVPIVFLGTVGFSLRKEGRYFDLKHLIKICVYSRTASNTTILEIKYYKISI
jgi:hypothetical protein